MVFPFILCFLKFQGKLLFQLVPKHPLLLSSDQIIWISNSFGLVFCSFTLGGVKLVAPWLRQMVQLFGTTAREIWGSRPRGCSLPAFWHISSISVAHQWHISGTSVAHQWHLSGTSVAHHWHIRGTSMAHQWYHQWHISGTVLLEQQLGMLLTSTVCTELSGKAFRWAALKDVGQPRRESGHSQCRSLLPAA